MKNAFVRIHELDLPSGNITFLEGYRWPTPEHTFEAFQRAKAGFSVEFEYAVYVVNLYIGQNILLDSFWMDEPGNEELKQTCWIEANIFQPSHDP